MFSPSSSHPVPPDPRSDRQSLLFVCSDIEDYAPADVLKREVESASNIANIDARDLRSSRSDNGIIVRRGGILGTIMGIGEQLIPGLGGLTQVTIPGSVTTSTSMFIISSTSTTSSTTTSSSQTPPTPTTTKDIPSSSKTHETHTSTHTSNNPSPTDTEPSEPVHESSEKGQSSEHSPKENGGEQRQGGHNRGGEGGMNSEADSVPNDRNGDFFEQDM